MEGSVEEFLQFDTFLGTIIAHTAIAYMIHPPSRRARHGGNCRSLRLTARHRPALSALLL